jgi:hypothetical protein
MTTQPLTIDKLADALVAAAPDLDPAGERLFLATYRLLAAGHPVTAAELSAATGLENRPSPMRSAAGPAYSPTGRGG